jgi:hypothetical protein
MTTPTLREAARAICRVQYNGGDPDQPAVRWNGTEMEPQEFPAWEDFLDEARAVIAALAQPGEELWHQCPDCKNHFLQPFVCTTCGAQKLYDTTVFSQQQVLDAQAARIERLERALEAWVRSDDYHSASNREWTSIGGATLLAEAYRLTDEARK